jgi:hypothetical protein
VLLRRLATAEGAGVFSDSHINMARAGEDSSAAMPSCVTAMRTRANQLGARERRQEAKATVGMPAHNRVAD